MNTKLIQDVPKSVRVLSLFIIRMAFIISIDAIGIGFNVLMYLLQHGRIYNRIG